MYEIQLPLQYDCKNDPHPYVKFKPHHVHNNLLEENKIKEEISNKIRPKKDKNKFNITDSFLSGFLGIDYIAITNKLIELEEMKISKSKNGYEKIFKFKSLINYFFRTKN